MGEIREAIEISTKSSDPARPFNLKRVHLRGAASIVDVRPFFMFFVISACKRISKRS